MGIPLWEKPKPSSSDKHPASARCENPWSVDPQHEYWGTDADSSSSSSSLSSHGTSTATVAALTARDDTDLPPIRRQRGRGLRALAAAAAAATVAGRDGADPEGGLVTLDEFLRETGQAGSASSEAERHLQMLLLMHRRSDRERAAESPWRRSMFDHTPVGRLRAAPFDASAPAAATTGERAGGDSFDTLVGQIRRIGALQDLMLNTVDTTAATLEDTVGSGRAAEASPPTEEEEQPANRRDRNRSIVDGLRVREARLRAMQMRIDQLVSEFATLRSTQRELRRVQAEQHALDIQGRVGLDDGIHEQLGLPPIDRFSDVRFVRRALLQPHGSSAVDRTTETPVSANSELQQRLQERINRVSVPAAAAVSVDRRTPAITETERDLMLRNAVMQMQIESLASEGIHPADEGVRLQ